MAKKSGGKGLVQGLMGGLKTLIPDAPGSSSALKGPSVNAEATRKGVAPTPSTLGPRKA